MTVTNADAAPGLVQPVLELFSNPVTALWATTYSVDLSLVNEFLLPRLGEPPLNVVVLADDQRLAASLARVPLERADTLAAVNRRWLLRGIHAGGHVFHPKTYLAVTPNRATLLVGSGNLSASGLDEGYEVFTTFRSGLPVGEAAIAAWTAWMRRIVEMAGDLTLAKRFKDLETRIPDRAASVPSAPPPLLHNLDRPIAEQLAAAVVPGGRGVDELLLTAPFYDPEAGAVSAMLDSLSPARVHLFITESTQVNGDRLVERVLDRGVQLTVSKYEPDRFVHAKLVGVIAGGTGWLLSGSANLSLAALTSTPRDAGNVEIAVLAPLTPGEVRGTFAPPGLRIVEAGLEALSSLTARYEPEPTPPVVRLVSATLARDGRIEVVSDPFGGAAWALSDLSGRSPLAIDGSGRLMTAGPLAGRLVLIVDEQDGALSNRVVVDDPVALEDVLTASSSSPLRDAPPELSSGDLDTPLGQALTWLHRNLVMDVSERVTGGQTGGVGLSEAGDQADEGLWVRLEREQLARDSRWSTYERVWRRDARGDEPIIELLDALRSRVPVPAAGRSVLALLMDGSGTDVDLTSARSQSHWSAAARIRVRVRNVLRRWAAAQTDPRLVWVNPLAPAGNFSMIASVLAGLRLDRARDPERVELTDEDLDEMWRCWLESMVGTEKAEGWLDRLDDDSRALIRNHIPTGLGELVAALCFLALRPGKGYRQRVVALQPSLARALDHDLLEPTDATASYVSAVSGLAVSRAEVDARLLSAVGFIDDALWCSRMAEELALEGLALQASSAGDTRQVRLDVRGIDAPLLDPRVPRLTVAVRRYRRCDEVVLFAADLSWRLAFANGNTIMYVPQLNHGMVESNGELTDGVLESLISSSGVLADLFPPSVLVA